MSRWKHTGRVNSVGSHLRNIDSLCGEGEMSLWVASGVWPMTEIDVGDVRGRRLGPVSAPTYAARQIYDKLRVPCGYPEACLPIPTSTSITSITSSPPSPPSSSSPFHPPSPITSSLVAAASPRPPTAAQSPQALIKPRVETACLYQKPHGTKTTAELACPSNKS